ncbi:DUF2231 domain-containing protein [Paenibacillus sp. VCA1]|uniref:DUF2231 domain-containing protein n=1 Tax=Paenibacillus sp. VCA1 TaxID=3039148 RepID=UPI002871191A|nr:DUF2231 domain-containing protein [Paenibacillus sp. VCA1]MDR9856177.1 DUF2231 domain-containing protein [Paenibacillus sp. VCA1]
MTTPLHPLIVHFPIALLFLAAVMQLFAIWRPRLFDRTADILLGLGFLSGIAAYMTGDGGERYAISVFGATRDMIHKHENIAFYTLIVYGLLLAVKILFRLPGVRRRFAAGMRWASPLVMILSLAGLVLVYYTGHYGGQIVYHGTQASANP